ncbi:hypothetical protein C8R44DRAFT_882505 [Mycena epipterygia]|nr:hypothetical protein C8R44DRAFT_882505 [Mycena epipterygia]
MTITYPALWRVLDIYPSAEFPVTLTGSYPRSMMETILLRSANLPIEVTIDTWWSAGNDSIVDSRWLDLSFSVAIAGLPRALSIFPLPPLFLESFVGPKNNFVSCGKWNSWASRLISAHLQDYTTSSHAHPLYVRFCLGPPILPSLELLFLTYDADTLPNLVRRSSCQLTKLVLADYIISTTFPIILQGIPTLTYLEIVDYEKQETENL